VAEVDEAAFQKLNNYDESPQSIMLSENQQSTCGNQGRIYFLVTMQTTSGEVKNFPLFKADLALPPAAPTTLKENSPVLTSNSEICKTGVDD